jgi:urease accessory protein
MRQVLRRLWPWLLLVTPELAFAHSPIKGIHYFYNGILHPVLVPAHLILLIALGLFWGQRGLQRMQIPLLVFVVGAALGLALSAFNEFSLVEILLLAAALVLGLLGASAYLPPPPAYLVLGGVTGLLLGFDSSQLELAASERIVAYLGTALGMYFLLLYLITLSEFCQRRDWTRIGVRVVSSWVSAASILVLTLRLTG